MMPDKKDHQKDAEEKEKSFTGSPEQQFPDLEAEDERDRQDQQSEKEGQSKEKSES